MDNEFEELKQNVGSDESNEVTNEDKGTNESVEGGWGYVVCFGVIICFIAGMGHINSFGLIYNDFIIESHSSAKSLTTAHGTFAMMLAAGGIIVNIMSKLKVSLRLCGFIGALTFCCGSFLTILITNISQLLFTFGILQGIGFGIIVSVTYSTLNRHFVRKRTTVMSVCKGIQGLVLIWYPQFIKNIVVYYGFRGTLVLISGISLHMFPGIAVMRSKEKKQRNEFANDLESQNNLEERVDFINHNGEEKQLNMKVNKIKKARYILEEILCFKVLKDNIFINICIGQSFVNYSDLAFFMLQPMILYQYGYNSAEVATCISIGAGADVAGRFTLAFISSSSSLNTRLIFYTATCFTFIVKIIMLQVRKVLWMNIVTAVLGVLRAWLHVASPLVISNHVSHQDFPGAYALFMLISGLVNVSLAAIIGQLKDNYEDYVPAFYALSAFCIPCLILWPIEYILKK